MQVCQYYCAPSQFLFVRSLVFLIHYIIQPCGSISYSWKMSIIFMILFKSITLFYGTDNIPQIFLDISHIQYECGKYLGVLLVPQNIVMDLNDAMLCGHFEQSANIRLLFIHSG